MKIIQQGIFFSQLFYLLKIGILLYAMFLAENKYHALKIKLYLFYSSPGISPLLSAHQICISTCELSCNIIGYQGRAAILLLYIQYSYVYYYVIHHSSINTVNVSEQRICSCVTLIILTVQQSYILRESSVNHPIHHTDAILISSSPTFYYSLLLSSKQMTSHEQLL